MGVNASISLGVADNFIALCSVLRSESLRAAYSVNNPHCFIWRVDCSCVMQRDARSTLHGTFCHFDVVSLPRPLTFDAATIGSTCPSMILWFLNEVRTTYSNTSK